MKSNFLKLLLIFSFILITFSLMAQSSSGKGVENTDGSKFWGTSIGWGACGLNSSGDDGCSQGQYSQYFVFWIPTGPEEATGVTRSCDCASSGTAPQQTVEP